MKKAFSLLLCLCFLSKIHSQNVIAGFLKQDTVSVNSLNKNQNSFQENAEIGCNTWLKTPYQESWVGVGDLDIPGDQLTVEALYYKTTPKSGDPPWDGDLVSKHTGPSNVNYLLRAGHAEITTSNGFFYTPEICMIDYERVYHVAMVYDGKVLKYYRNGFLMSEIPVTGDMVQNNLETRIGYLDYSGNIENFIGYINEVKIWNVARSQEEIKAYMNTPLPNPSSQTGLLAYYTFNSLQNKQGNATWNGRLGGGATINNQNPDCTFEADSCLVKQSISNIINDYTEVIDFDICTNELLVTDAAKYGVGDTVVIMQMKGAIIDSTNTSNFGNITNYNNSGNYEFNIIKSKNGNKLTLLNLLKRTYDIPNGKVQLIRVPYYDNVDVSSTLTCLPWDGSKGGVLAFNVKKNIDMRADIDVSEVGFRAGNPMRNTKATFNQQGYFYDGLSNNGAEKGEGIYSISDEINYGRGASANGGGGGNAHNTGGGGGANGGAGGDGGDQWITQKTITEQVGGKGGKALANSASINKLFLGGGAGMGQANDLFEYPAGNGGGIIIINAGSLTANNFSLKANGGDGIEAPYAAVADDGVGGGGGGGSILLNIPIITGNAALQVKGGNGANHIANNVLQGPGGGGGGGVIAFSQPIVSSQFTMNNSGGKNGVNINLANNAWGSTPGMSGKTFTNFSPVIDDVLFKKNIDSVRISDTVTLCNAAEFKGLSFVQNYPVNSWYWNFGDGATGNIQTINHEFNTAGTFDVKLVVTDINGCKDSLIKPITTILLEIIKSPDTSVCLNSSVKIFADGGATYQWTPSAGLDDPNISSPVASPLTTTKYFVNVTKVPGCSAMDSVTIFVNELPVITKSNDKIVCKGTSVPLFAGGGVVYSWSPSGSLSDSGISNPVAQPQSTTIYKVAVTDGNGCTNFDSINISLFPVPVMNISNDTSICKNSTVQLSVTGGNTYSWLPVSLLDNPLSATPIAHPTDNTIFYVKITDNNLCTYNDSVNVSIRPESVFNISPDTKVCLNTNTQLSASGGDEYIWSPTIDMDDPTSSNPLVNPKINTNYSVIISEKTCGKKDTLYTTVSVMPLPIVSAKSSNEITCTQPYSQLTATGSGQSVSWSPASGLDDTSIYNPVATPTSSTLYTVTIKNNNGCTNKDTVLVKVNYSGKVFYELPNAFTPNGDGINDCFGVKNWGSIEKFDLKIYNRFGQMVFATSNPNDCWAGTYKGQPQDADVFVYIVKGETACGAISRKGTVTLLR